MKLTLQIFFISVIASMTIAFAQDNNDNDAEQQYLSDCYYYSGLLGFNIDSIYNFTLYKSLSDWLGVKYRYSGESKKGVDCSGFACSIYRDAFSKEINGSAADLYKAATPLKKDELREGDLVFFKIRKKRISHVGVYLSRNRFIHASVHEGVVVSDLDDPYYKKRFFRGGRIPEKG